jgi:histidine ammonia-lyase
MGMAAAIKLNKVVKNTRYVLAIEACAAAQAIDFLAPLQPGPRGQVAQKAIRSVTAKVEHDRILAGDFELVAKLIARGDLTAALR